MQEVKSAIIKEGHVQFVKKELIAKYCVMHPVSVLYEIAMKFGWNSPNIGPSFEMGMPPYKLFIYKVSVQYSNFFYNSIFQNFLFIFQCEINGEIFQPTIAVDNKKDAKTNAAWFTLQVKKST